MCTTTDFVGYCMHLDLGDFKIHTIRFTIVPSFKLSRHCKCTIFQFFGIESTD